MEFFRCSHVSSLHRIIYLDESLQVYMSCSGLQNKKEPFLNLVSRMTLKNSSFVKLFPL